MEIQSAETIIFSWSSQMITSTALFAGALILATVFIIRNTKDRWRMLGMLPVVALLAAVSFLPLYITVTDEGIVLKRVLGGIYIDRQEITEIQLIEKDELGIGAESSSLDAAFGYTGKFKDNYGTQYSVFASHLDRYIIVKTLSRDYIIGPGEADLLARLLGSPDL